MQNIEQVLKKKKVYLIEEKSFSFDPRYATLY